MPARGVREAPLVLAGAALLAVVLTWPLASGIGRYGRTNSTDGMWSLWVVSWVAHALTTAPTQLYDANIFHPSPNALAFSEPNVGAGALAIPVWLATRNPFAAYNSVVLASFVLGAAFAYALGKYVTGHRGGAAFCGIAFAFCPYVFARLPHIQLMITWGIPLALLAMHRMIDRPSAGRAAALGLALFVQAISCAYYGVAAALAVGVGVLYFAVARRGWRQPRYWGAVVFAAAIAIGLVLPFLLPSVGLQGATDFRRTLTESSRYSADWKSYLASSAWAHRWLLPYLRTWNDVLFPGLLPIGFATVGTFATLGGRSAPDPGPAVTLGPRNGGRTTGPARPDAVGPRELGGYYVLLTALAFWVSLGPQAGLYTVLFHAIPVFSFLRAPARFGIVVVLGLAVLSAIGVAHATRRRRPAGVPRAELLCLLLVAELCVAPLALPDNSQPVNAAYRYLATQPRAPVVELPFFYRRIDYHRHAYYLLNSTRHWQPLVNGYSDYIPQDFRDHAVAISSFPNPESFALLRARGVRFVVFTLRFYNRDAKSAVLERIASYGQYLRPVTRDRDVLLYEIVEWPAP